MLPGMAACDVAMEPWRAEGTRSAEIVAIEFRDFSCFGADILPKVGSPVAVATRVRSLARKTKHEARRTLLGRSYFLQ